MAKCSEHEKAAKRCLYKDTGTVWTVYSEIRITIFDESHLRGKEFEGHRGHGALGEEPGPAFKLRAPHHGTRLGGRQ